MALYDEWLTDEGLEKIRGWVTEGISQERIAEEKMLIAYSTLKKWRKQFKELDDILPHRQNNEYQTDGSQAKAYLNGYKNRWVEKAEKIERLNDARVELLEKATSTTSQLNPVRVQTSHRNDKIERSVIDAESLAERIRAIAARVKAENKTYFTAMTFQTLKISAAEYSNIVLTKNK